MGTHLKRLRYVVQALNHCTTLDKTNGSSSSVDSARIVSRVPLIRRTRETPACCESWDVRVFPRVVSQSKEHKRKAYHRASLSFLYRFVRTVAKQQQPRGCIRYREYYCCRRTLPPIVPGQSTGIRIFLSAVLSGASGCAYHTRTRNKQIAACSSMCRKNIYVRHASPKQRYGSQWWRPNYVETCRAIV